MSISGKLLEAEQEGYSVIALCGQPASGKSYGVVEYAIEKALEGRSVCIFRDTERQIKTQGGLQHTYGKLVCNLPQAIQDKLDSLIQLCSLQDRKSLGKLADIMIYDQCRTYLDGSESASWCKPKVEVVTGYYSDVVKSIWYLNRKVGEVAMVKSYVTDNPYVSDEFKNSLNALSNGGYHKLMYMGFGDKCEGDTTIQHGNNSMTLKSDGSIAINNFIINPDGTMSTKGNQCEFI